MVAARGFMLIAAHLLLAIGLLGAFDVFYFHRGRFHLSREPSSRAEAWVHVVRGFVYTAQFLVVPNLRFAGAAFGLLIALYAVDVAVALIDVYIEPHTRGRWGGLPPGESLMHTVLSVLVGGYLFAVFAHAASWRALPTAIALSPAAPLWLRTVLAGLAVGCAALSLIEVAELTVLRHRPPPIHVRVRVRASAAEVWRITQDHHHHPTWDHRFSRIVMLSDQVKAGTTMHYEKRLLGMTIRGFGRYQLHRPLEQSTFAFWSEDRRSLIRRGVGLWLYVPTDDGHVEFRTSYTYEVRWGVVGQLLDRALFRRLIQRETERSFRRLVRLHFAGGASAVVGRSGRKPAPFPVQVAA